MLQANKVIPTWLLEGLATTLPDKAGTSSSLRDVVRPPTVICSELTLLVGTHLRPPTQTVSIYIILHPATLYESTWANMIYSLTRDRYYLRNTARFVQDRTETDMLQELTRDNVAPATAPTTDEESASSSSSYTTSTSSWRQDRAPAQSWQ